MSKKYVLELTAEELKNYEYLVGKGCPAIVQKLHQLAQQARADIERDDLRLPWTARMFPGPPGCGWHVFNGCGGDLHSERAAMIQAAGHDLLEAVKAVDRHHETFVKETCYPGSEWLEIVRLVKRALRKVETGHVEP